MLVISSVSCYTIKEAMSCCSITVKAGRRFLSSCDNLLLFIRITRYRSSVPYITSYPSLFALIGSRKADGKNRPSSSWVRKALCSFLQLDGWSQGRSAGYVYRAHRRWNSGTSNHIHTTLVMHELWTWKRLRDVILNMVFAPSYMQAKTKMNWSIYLNNTVWYLWINFSFTNIIHQVQVLSWCCEAVDIGLLYNI